MIVHRQISQRVELSTTLRIPAQWLENTGQLLRLTTPLNGVLLLTIPGHHFLEVGEQCLLNLGLFGRILWRGFVP